MQPISTPLGRSQAALLLRASSSSGLEVKYRARSDNTDPLTLSEGKARVSVARAIGAMATLRIGSAPLRELLALMLRFLPADALVSGRPWLPMGARKLADLAGIDERTLARRVAELRALGLLDRHLDRWNHPAVASDGRRCGYDLTPLVEKAAQLNAELDRFFDDHKRVRQEARRSHSREAAEQARAVARSPLPTLARETGGADGGVTPINTIHPDSIESLVNSLGESRTQRAGEHPAPHAGLEVARTGKGRARGVPGPRVAGRLLTTLSPDFAHLLHGLAGNADKPSESELLAAAEHLARHLGVPQAAWASVPPGSNRVSLAAVVVLGHAQDDAAFRTSRVAWVTAMLRRPDADIWSTVYRARAQQTRGLPTKPERFLN